MRVVDPLKPTGVRFTQGRMVTLKVGETLALETELAPATARTALTWRCARPRIAGVDALGRVIALRPGKARVTVVTANGRKARITIKVVE